jgi:hypothetical protein
MRYIAVTLLVAAVLCPVAAQARLGPGDALYDAVAKRVQIPQAPNVEVVERNPFNTIGLQPYWPQLRNLKLMAAVLRWYEKEPGVSGSILLYKPSVNTLGSVASLERYLRQTSLREPASAAAITEDAPGGPRNDVWCPRPIGTKAVAYGLEIVLVEGVPALNFKFWPSNEVPECKT